MIIMITPLYKTPDSSYVFLDIHWNAYTLDPATGGKSFRLLSRLLDNSPSSIRLKEHNFKLSWLYRKKLAQMSDLFGSY